MTLRLPRKEGCVRRTEEFSGQEKKWAAAAPSSESSRGLGILLLETSLGNVSWKLLLEIFETAV
jgi:hypothetical protein